MSRGGILKRIISPLYSSSSSSHLLLKSQIPKPNPNFALSTPSSSSSNLRFFCSSKDNNSEEEEDPIITPNLKKLFPGIKHYNDQEYNKMIEDYRNGNKNMISVLLNAMLVRKIYRKYGEVDREVLLEIGEDIKKQEDYEEEFYNWPWPPRPDDDGLTFEQSQEVSESEQFTATQRLQSEPKLLECYMQENGTWNLRLLQ